MAHTGTVTMDIMEMVAAMITGITATTAKRLALTAGSTTVACLATGMAEADTADGKGVNSSYC
jgi:hypothetical protein